MKTQGETEIAKNYMYKPMCLQNNKMKEANANHELRHESKKQAH